jgi:hypothetical protein
LTITTVDTLARFELTVTRVADDASCDEEEPTPTTLGVCDDLCGPSRYYYPQ